MRKQAVNPAIGSEGQPRQQHGHALVGPGATHPLRRVPAQGARQGSLNPTHALTRLPRTPSCLPEQVFPGRGLPLPFRKPETPGSSLMMARPAPSEAADVSPGIETRSPP